MIRLKNTLSGEKEELISLEKGKLNMYVCGPTVYGPGHIGHARTYVAFDIIRRYLESRGFAVNYVVNITDVHDDMIEQAKKEELSLKELGDKYTKVFFEDLKELKIKPATRNPRVTEEIKDIIQFVKNLQEKGHAYETEDGVYFDISSFARYGKLSGVQIKEQKTGTRVQADKYDRSKPQDFALWKKAKPGEPSWDSPWGKGRPGWHIECSLMSSKYLGKQLDIHAGAVDLIFPHHENEIAQSECALDVHPFVRYWLHSGFLNVEGQKMSKSLGNFITIPALLKDYDPRVFRFFVSRLHYRSRVDFTKKDMANARTTLEGLNELLARLQDASTGTVDKPAPIVEWVEEARKGFDAAMGDDFNLPNAWVAVFAFTKKLNTALDAGQVGTAEAEKALSFFRELDELFQAFSFPAEEALPKELQDLIEKREQLRKEKRFEDSDKIRAQLEEKGILLLDMEKGTSWRRVKD